MSLQYNVSKLLKEPVGSTRSYDVDGRFLADEEGPDLRDVSGEATFLRTKEGILVSARLDGVEHDRCSRCLRDIELPVTLEFQEEFLPEIEVRTGVKLSRPKDPEAFRIDEHLVLDLAEAVRQFWTAALPMQPLCRPDCRGLCPQCGKDWNEGPCDCSPPADERWGTLRGLLARTDRK